MDQQLYVMCNILSLLFCKIHFYVLVDEVMVMTVMLPTSSDCLCVRVLQAVASASSHQSFIDEYFGGEYETTYLCHILKLCMLVMCCMYVCVHCVLFFSVEKQSEIFSSSQQ